MDTAAEKEPVFGMDEGKRLNVGRKNEFFEGKMLPGIEPYIID